MVALPSAESHSTSNVIQVGRPRSSARSTRMGPTLGPTFGAFVTLSTNKLKPLLLQFNFLASHDAILRIALRFFFGQAQGACLVCAAPVKTRIHVGWDAKYKCQ